MMAIVVNTDTVLQERLYTFLIIKCYVRNKNTLLSPLYEIGISFKSDTVVVLIQFLFYLKKCLFKKCPITFVCYTFLHDLQKTISFYVTSWLGVCSDVMTY